MKAARIHVFGAAGAGVTTLARALAECLGSRYLDADDYLWMPTEPPYQTKRPIVDRVRGCGRIRRRSAGCWEDLWTHGEVRSFAGSV